MGKAGVHFDEEVADKVELGVCPLAAAQPYGGSRCVVALDLPFWSAAPGQLLPVAAGGQPIGDHGGWLPHVLGNDFDLVAAFVQRMERVGLHAGGALVGVEASLAADFDTVDEHAAGSVGPDLQDRLDGFEGEVQRIQKAHARMQEGGIGRCHPFGAGIAFGGAQQRPGGTQVEGLFGGQAKFDQIEAWPECDGAL